MTCLSAKLWTCDAFAGEGCLRPTGFFGGADRSIVEAMENLPAGFGGGGFHGGFGIVGGGARFDGRSGGGCFGGCRGSLGGGGPWIGSGGGGADVNMWRQEQVSTASPYLDPLQEAPGYIDTRRRLGATLSQYVPRRLIDIYDGIIGYRGVNDYL